MSKSSTSSPRIVVVFRNDDPSAASDVARERRLFEIFEHWKVPQTIGVVPNMTLADRHVLGSGGTAPLAGNPAMVELLTRHCDKVGSELALHGFTHQTNRFSLPARRFYFEFARLPLAEQEELIRNGAGMLREVTGRTPRTFIPPWNRGDANTLLACERAGMRVFSSWVYAPPAPGLLAFGCNSTLPEFAGHLELAKRSERRVFINVLLHTPLMRSEEEHQLLDRVLRTVREEPACAAMTIADAATRYPEELREYNLAGRSIIGLYEDMDTPRARAHVYTAAGLGRRVGTLQREAVTHYRTGNYASCRPIDQRIEAVSQRYLWTCRVVALLAALVVGRVLVSVVPQAVNALLGVGFVVLWLGAMLVMSRATSPDTRHEVAMLTAFVNSGLLIGRFV